MTSRVQMLVTISGISELMIEIHTNIDIPFIYEKGFNRPFRPIGVMWDALPDIGQVIVERMFQIDGVIAVQFSPYCITIHRARLFSSEVILGDITQGMQDIFKEVLDITCE